MNNFVYHNPTEILFGKGQLAKLGSKIEQFGRKILLVYGGGSIKRIGLYEQLQNIFAQYNCQVVELSGVEPNPRLTTVQRGIELFRQEGLEWILAVGGGSVLDAAKAVAVGVPYDGDVWDFYMRKAVAKQAVPLGTVLTLAATGSEMNRSSVVTNWETKQKHGASTTFPAFSILDPEFTYSVPRDQTVNGICDIMSHVFEQYFTHTSDIPLQTRFAEAIMLTVIENAERVLANPQDYGARANLLYCGTMALNGTLPVGVETDWATHKIEHAVSAVYDIPHGAGLAILFPNWMKYVYRENIQRFKRFATQVWQVECAGKTDEQIALEGIEQTRQFFTRIGAPSRLADVGIGDERLRELAQKSVPFGPIGACKQLDEQDVYEILRMSL